MGANAVEVLGIDAMFAKGERPITFMKVDVEGNEMGVLRSARAMLLKQRIHHVAVELRKADADAFVKLMYDEAGYVCRWSAHGWGWIAGTRKRLGAYMPKQRLVAEINQGTTGKHFIDTHCWVQRPTDIAEPSTMQLS